VYKGKCHCCGRSLESAWQDELHIISHPDRTGILRKYCSECVIFKNVSHTLKITIDMRRIFTYNVDRGEDILH